MQNIKAVILDLGGVLLNIDYEKTRKAFAGLVKNVTADGVVKGTCQGTNIGKDLDYYINRPHPDDDMHGRGVTLLAGTEILLAGKK